MMSRQHIEIRQSFNAPVEKVFSILTDHESFGRIIGTNIKRVVDSQGDNKNGVGSTRRISSPPIPAFEETVTKYEPNRLMEYFVSKGSPIKNHIGRMAFTEEDGKTNLYYTIDFDPKWPFVLLGGFLRQAIDKPIRKGIERLAASYES